MCVGVYCGIFYTADKWKQANTCQLENDEMCYATTILENIMQPLKGMIYGHTN